MIKSDFNRCFIFGPKMRIFGRFGPLWPFWPIYWPEIQKNMIHTFHICPGKPPQGGIQNLRFLGGRIIFTIENTSVNAILHYYFSKCIIWFALFFPIIILNPDFLKKYLTLLIHFVRNLAFVNQI